MHCCLATLTVTRLHRGCLATGYTWRHHLRGIPGFAMTTEILNPSPSSSNLASNICKYIKSMLENRHRQRRPHRRHMSLWTFYKQIYRCLPIFIFEVWMKHEVSRLRIVFVVLVSQWSVDRRHYDLDLLTQNHYFFILHLCMKYEVSRSFFSFYV